LPYMPTDLHRVIQSKQAFTEKHIQVIMCQLLRGLAHLHCAGVAHRDLKPANILVNGECRIKVCDFGLARGDMPDQNNDDSEAYGVLTEYVVTRWYRAPEVMLLPKNYTSAVDIWSVGCILCEILGRKPLFPGKNHVDMIRKVTEVLGSPSDEELSWLPRQSDAYRFLKKVCPKQRPLPLSTLYPSASSGALELANSLLRWDPCQRLTAKEAQEHRYLVTYLPSEPAEPPELFDWSFDGFTATTSVVKEKLYQECAKFHPEMLTRDETPRSAHSPSVSATVSAGSSGGRTAHNRFTSVLKSMMQSSSQPVMPSALQRLQQQAGSSACVPPANQQPVLGGQGKAAPVRSTTPLRNLTLTSTPPSKETLIAASTSTRSNAQVRSVTPPLRNMIPRLGAMMGGQSMMGGHAHAQPYVRVRAS